MVTMSESLESSKEYVKNIIPNIEEILSNNNINFSSNAHDTEIVIHDAKYDDILKTIYTNIGIPKIVLMVLIDVNDNSGNIYIRLKSK